MVYPGEGKERFIWIELVGFFFLIIGTLIHTEILVVPFCGFGLYTRKALEENAQDKNDIMINNSQNYNNDKATNELLTSPNKSSS